MNIKKGDHVKVKSWRELMAHPMVRIDGSGNISEMLSPYSFTRYMERYCKCKATVIRADEKKEEIFLQFDGKEAAEEFIFREWMLEHAQEDKPDSVTVYIVEKD